MKIRLPWIEPINLLDLPKNFDYLVMKSFHDYTEGTAKAYEYEDKLVYLDSLRKFLHPGDADECVRELVKERVDYEMSEYGNIPDRGDFFSVEFMEECFDKGFRPYRDKYDHYSHSRNEEILKAILRIIQLVANYSEEAFEKMEAEE